MDWEVDFRKEKQSWQWTKSERKCQTEKRKKRITIKAKKNKPNRKSQTKERKKERTSIKNIKIK